MRRIRAIPGKLGIRPHTVQLLSRSWTGTHSGDGVRSDVELDIVEADSQPPKVRWLADDEIAVGALTNGTIEIGPITSNAAWLLEIQGDSLSIGDARYLLITGPKHPNGAKYRATRVTAHKAMHYLIQAQPVDSE
jgi:hypothetical protein